MSETAVRDTRLRQSLVGHKVAVMRRRLAVSAAVLAAVAGEWLGHGLAYYRVAGVAGLQAGLTSGFHDHMLPRELALLLGAATGGMVWTRAWLALGRRLDRSGAALARLRRGGRMRAAPNPSGAPRRPGPAPSVAAQVATLAAAIPLVQCVLHVVHENLERTIHGLGAPGIGPLLDGFGAAAWIQAVVALVLATLVVAALRLLRSRDTAARLCEGLSEPLWARAQRWTSSVQPRGPYVIPAHPLLGGAISQRPSPRYRPRLNDVAVPALRSPLHQLRSSAEPEAADLSFSHVALARMTGCGEVPARWPGPKATLSI